MVVFVLTETLFACAHRWFRSLGPRAFKQLSFKPLFIALAVIQKRVLNEIIHIAPGGFGCNTLYLCVPKEFLSVQLGSEIPRQLIASFSSPFLQLSPLSMRRFKSSSRHLVPPLIHCLLCIPKISMTVFSAHNVRSPFFLCVCIFLLFLFCKPKHCVPCIPKKGNSQDTGCLKT